MRPLQQPAISNCLIFLADTLKGNELIEDFSIIDMKIPIAKSTHFRGQWAVILSGDHEESDKGFADRKSSLPSIAPFKDGLTTSRAGLAFPATNVGYLGISQLGLRSTIQETREQ